jgi:cytochrome c553
MTSGLRVLLPMLLVVPQPAGQAQMRAHFDQALVLHEAVIQGNLPAVGTAARALADQVTESQTSAPALASSRPLAALADGARKVAQSRTILAAAIETAGMLSACGRCHRAAGVTPAFPAPSQPVATGLTGHMQEHQVAVRQLVEGLVVPSDAAWRNGARALAAAPLNATELPVDAALRRQLAPTEERLHRLATGAAESDDPFARAAFYGQLLAACADCHTRYAKVARPRP